VAATAIAKLVGHLEQAPEVAQSVRMRKTLRTLHKVTDLCHQIAMAPEEDWL
jgi:hypothetical protein